MKYILKTTYPCIVKTATSSVELDVNDSLEIEDERNVFIYPQNCYQIPFCINLIQKQDSNLFSFVKIKSENYIILEDNNFVFTLQKEKLLFNGKTCTVFVGKTNISFETESKVVKCKIFHNYRKYQIFKCGDYACVQFEKNFYAYSIKDEKLYKFAGDELTFEKNTLHIKKQFNNFERNMKVVFDNNLEILQQNSEKTAFGCKKFVAYTFLDFIKKKEFSLPIELLVENLKEKITQEKLQSFFGNLQNVIPLTEKEFIITSQSEKKYVAFEIENNKICDISIDEL